MASSTPRYSVVIPVFNSEGVVAETVRRTCAFFDDFDPSFEIVLVDDGSTDASWEVISNLAKTDVRVIALRLLHNCGQHAANLCGFRHARGEWIITIDDDLQNPPEEVTKLVEKSHEGHDLVIGQFRSKRHASYRRLGTRVVRLLNRRIFGARKDLVLTNFRLIRRDVVDRICAYRGPYPYIPGLCLLYSCRQANALVEHRARAIGQSNYNWRRILQLVAAILFNYSSFPLRVAAGIGLSTAVLSFLLGLYYFVDGLVSGSSVPGWTTIVVLLSFMNGVIMLMLGMLGEYVIRIISQIGMTAPYIVAATTRSDGE